MNEKWQQLNLEECIEQVKYPNKIPRKNFLEKGKFPIISQEQEFINGYWTNPVDVFRVNKPIIIFGDHTKIFKYVDFDFVLGADGVKILKPKDFIDSKYFYYFLNSCKIKSLGYARHYRILKELNIRFPTSLFEQKRIVAILDEAFEEIDRAIGNTEKNLANARELFESYLNAIFTHKNHGWEEKKLEDICKEITVGHVGSMASKYKDSGIPFLRSQNILPFRINLDNVVFIDEEFHSALKKSQLKPGDLAIVRTGYPGTAAVIPDELEIVNCSDLVIVKPGQNINPHYLSLFFNSVFGKALVGSRLVGAAQKHFNITTAKRVLIPFPCLTEQNSLVTKTDELAAETQRLETIYRRKLAALNELKQSILQKAFTGELTADTPKTVKEKIAA